MDEERILCAIDRADHHPYILYPVRGRSVDGNGHVLGVFHGIGIYFDDDVARLDALECRVRCAVYLTDHQAVFVISAAWYHSQAKLPDGAALQFSPTVSSFFSGSWHERLADAMSTREPNGF